MVGRREEERQHKILYFNLFPSSGIRQLGRVFGHRIVQRWFRRKRWKKQKEVYIVVSWR
jgi:hypothetical protein